MNTLGEKHCIPCSGKTPRLASAQIEALRPQLHEAWRVMEDHHLTREYSMADFKSALAFVNDVGGLAEEEGHHPDLFFAWGKVKITLFTHAIDGLSEADFILAAKIDGLEMD
ncbi:MAG: 4a-hydroxytetrahydrobiopterin dehydratase [Deltaproteobacteria bacterium]|nr:4a-hydroxytetrahydrobiopterin dehydratase [Deltaproteobacteria bacterium]